MEAEKQSASASSPLVMETEKQSTSASCPLVTEAEKQSTSSSSPLVMETEKQSTSASSQLVMEAEKQSTSASSLLVMEAEKQSTSASSPLVTETEKQSASSGSPLVMEAEKQSTSASSPLVTEAEKQSTSSGSPLVMEAEKQSASASSPLVMEAEEQSPSASSPLVMEAEKQSTSSGLPLVTEAEKQSTSSSSPLVTDAEKQSTSRGSPLVTEAEKQSASSGSPLVMEAEKQSTSSGSPLVTEAEKQSTSSGSPLVMEAEKQSTSSGSPLVMEAEKQSTSKWEMLVSGEYQQSMIFLDYGWDPKRPIIADMVVTEDGRLVIADSQNLTMKVMSLSSLKIITEEYLTVKPERLALLSDGMVAMTTSQRSIGLLDISKAAKMKSLAKTFRRYYGIVEGPDEDTLIVSCAQDEDGPAFVDIIRRDGSIVRIIADTRIVEGMKSPGQMCVVGEHLFVPERFYDCVFEIEISSSRLVKTISCRDMESPTQVVWDGVSSLHIQSREHNLCLVYTAEREWEHYELTGKYVAANLLRTVCPTASGFVASFVNDPTSPTVSLLMTCEPAKARDWSVL